MLTLAQSSSVDLGQALVGLPVAAVIVILALLGYRALSKGDLVMGREHRAALDELAFYRSMALRLLNVSEAALGRRESDG